MPTTIYNKLIRDRIPEIIIADGGKPDVRVLDETAFKTALRKKMLEEAHELSDAKTRDELLNELSDVLQLIESIAQAEQISMADVENAKEHKKQERGGFDQRLFLEKVEK
jgi:predicted house-cleaning noncanonical NTP pyrophosphatase (MazG superfamily)